MLVSLKLESCIQVLHFTPMYASCDEIFVLEISLNMM